MASIRKRDGSWVVDVRRTGNQAVGKSFSATSLVSESARSIESETDAHQYQDCRSLNSITFGDLIGKSPKEVSAVCRWTSIPATFLVNTSA